MLLSIFLATITFTLFSKIKNEISYWLLIIIGNIAGTNIADLICIDLNLGTIYGSLIVAFTLFIIIFLIKKIKKENFNFQTFLYWLTIITSSSFGTTSVDFLTIDTL